MVSLPCFARVLKVVKEFPSMLSSLWGFESKLCDTEPWVDMAVCIEKENGRILAGSHPQAELNGVLQQNEWWHNITLFSRDWVDPGSLLNKYVERIWLEFDIPENLPEIPVPAVFLNLSEKMSGGNTQDRLDEVLTVLAGRPIAPGTVENLSRCIESLPQGATINYVGFMPARNPDVLRINVAGLDDELLFMYLCRVGIQDCFVHLEKSLPDLSKFSDYFILCLDVGEKIDPKIGIELRYCEKELDLTTQYRHIPFLEYLARNRLCTEEKKAALVQWSGKSREIFDPELYQFVIFRYVYYFKAVFEPGKPFYLKGYVAFEKRSILSS